MQLTRRLNVAALLAFVATLFVLSSNAAALDGYEDRKRVFGGFALGGGAGAVHTGDQDNLSVFADEGYQMGFHASAILGGGVTDSLLIGAEANWWFRNVRKALNNNDPADDQKYAMQQWSILPVVNFFPVGGLRLDAGAGLAYGAFTGEHPVANLPFGELGFAGKLGVGYEFWLNGNTTLGVSAQYIRHFYSNGAFDTFDGSIGLRWY